MSLFNWVAGNNPMFGVLARIIETVAPLPPVPRFRDMYTDDHDGKLVIVLYTRTGGGNRAAHGSVNEAILRYPHCIEKGSRLRWQCPMASATSPSATRRRPSSNTPGRKSMRSSVSGSRC